MIVVIYFTPILIPDGGPFGLSLANDLSCLGIDAVLMEKMQAKD